MSALLTQFIGGHRFPDAFGAACVHRVHALDVWMPRIVSLNPRQLFVNGWPGGDLVKLDILARLLDSFPGAIHAWLYIQLAGGSNKPGDFTFLYRLDNPLTQGFARKEQVLADIAQPLVLSGVGITRHNRYTGRPCSFNGIMERSRVHQGNGDTVRLTGHGCVK